MALGVMVLAAGRGSRLGEAAGGLPKPLVPVAGGAPLVRTLEWLVASGVAEVWINVHYRAQAIRAAAGSGRRFGLRVRYSAERTLLGTAGGWRRVARASADAERWLVLYGDNVMRFDLARLLARHELAAGAGALATVALFDPGRHGHTGIAGGRARVQADGRVSSFVEGGSVREGLVNAGAYVLERRLVNMLPPDPCDFGRDVLAALATRGELAAHVLEEGAYCLGVDTPERLEIARSLLAGAA